ncbi:MMPL family transporter [Streptomyces xinghaiensis]|uniref:MMPL family transporter n=1 Tax=Streptomyces xinghaiensis TaxID=1038928 RepID=UPI0002E09D22|nr:MMPL family transporter [Streptomyces xinghaiensis]
MAALARWCIRRRFVVILVWLLALGGTALASTLAGSAFTDDYEIPGTESGRAAALMEKNFPGQGGDRATVVWHTDRGTVRAEAVEERMTATLDEIAGLPDVSSVSGPYGPDDTGRISPDGRTAYATVAFDAASGETGAAQAERLVATAEAAESPRPAEAAGSGGASESAGAVEESGLRVETGGSAIAKPGETGGHTAEFVGLAVAAVVLLLAFGSLAAMALPLATALVSVGTGYLGIGLLGHLMPVADFAPMLGLLVGLGVGIDYALFIVTRHRRGLRRGLSVTEAATRAVATSGRAVVFAGGTVFIALLGMLVLRLEFLNGVAVAASLTVLLAVAASVTLLPALLKLIGHRALSRRERRRLAEHGPEPEQATGFAVRWSAFVERHPRILGAVAVAVMAVLALPALGLHLGTSDQGNHPAGSTTRQAYDLLADGFGPGTNGPLTLVSEIGGPADRAAFDKLPGELRATDGVAAVTGATTDRDGGTGVITVVPETSPQDTATSELVERLRGDVLPEAQDGTGLRTHVGGPTAGYDDFASVITAKLPLFIGTVIASGSLLLLLAFRSVGIPLKAALMNVMAVTSSLGIVTAVFQWGWGSELLGLGAGGPIEPFLPVIMVSVLFGLSMDYQVFLVSRMYEEWRRTGDNRRSVRVGLAETSRVINSAAVIMIAVFGAFVLTGDRIIAMFGIGLAAAVALDAFVLRTLLVPALMHLLGGVNWWLPRWLDRLLPRISIEAPDDEEHEQDRAQEPEWPEGPEGPGGPGEDGPRQPDEPRGPGTPETPPVPEPGIPGPRHPADTAVPVPAGRTSVAARPAAPGATP